jgi:hypothetical protein
MKLVNMTFRIRLKVLRDGGLETSTKLYVGLSIRSLQVLDTQSQSHRVGFELGGIDQVAVRVVERAKVFRTLEDHAV